MPRATASSSWLMSLISGPCGVSACRSMSRFLVGYGAAVPGYAAWPGFGGVSARRSSRRAAAGSACPAQRGIGSPARSARRSSRRSARRWSAGRTATRGSVSSSSVSRPRQSNGARTMATSSPAAVDRSHGAAGVAEQQAHPWYLRVMGTPADDFLEQVSARAGLDGDGEAAVLGCRPAGALDRRSDPFDRDPSLLKQHRSGWSQGDAATGALKEAHPEFALQFADGRGQRWLGHAQACRGTGVKFSSSATAMK